MHRRRSGWNSGGRMASAEGGSVPSGVRYGEGCPLSSRLEGLGSVVSSPAKTNFGVFWRPKNAFCTYIWRKSEGTTCISVLLLQILPPPVTPVVTRQIKKSFKSLYLDFVERCDCLQQLCLVNIFQRYFRFRFWLGCKNYFILSRACHGQFVLYDGRLTTDETIILFIF